MNWIGPEKKVGITFLHVISGTLAGLAQLVEQLICRQQVGGSIVVAPGMIMWGDSRAVKRADCKSVGSAFEGSNLLSPQQRAPGSSVVERFLGKEKVGSSILLSGSSDIERHLVQASSSVGRAADSKSAGRRFDPCLACTVPSHDSRPVSVLADSSSRPIQTRPCSIESGNFLLTSKPNLNVFNGRLASAQSGKLPSWFWYR